MDNQTPTTMSGILASLLEHVSTERVTTGQIIDQLKHRGFGPILALLALFIIVLGAIPLLPAFIGMLIILVAIQMVIGWEHPWIPKKLRAIELEKNKLQHLLDFTHPYTTKLERLLKNRYGFIFNRVSEIITAITCIIIALTIITIGFIPLLPALLAIPIFLFGIGYTVQDGLVVIIGFLMVAASYWFMFLH
jgi:hypothetical protein